jgi:hypothetical protein
MVIELTDGYEDVRIFMLVHLRLSFVQLQIKWGRAVINAGSGRVSTLLVRMEDVILRRHGHMARVPAV